MLVSPYKTNPDDWYIMIEKLPKDYGTIFPQQICAKIDEIIDHINKDTKSVKVVSIDNALAHSVGIISREELEERSWKVELP